MNKIVTRGFGRNSTRQGIITQGYGGLLASVIRAASNLGRNVVAGGKSAARRIKKNIDEIIVRVTLLSVDDQYLDITGAEKSTPDQDMAKPQIKTSYFGKRFIEKIRLDVKRIK